MASVVMDRTELKTTESMSEMAERMSKELREEMHEADLHLTNWVAEREQRLADIQVKQRKHAITQCRSTVAAC